MRRGVSLLAAAVSAAIAQSASAQWLNFSEETSTRLQLSSVGTSDAQEKDMASADLNKDGWVDIVVGRKVPFASVSTNPGHTAVLLMNDNGVLKDRTSVYAPGFIANAMDCRDVLAVDIDNDTWMDIICANIYEGPRVYRNRGNDTGGQWLGLQDESSRLGPIVGSPSLTVTCTVWPGDIENDGDLDLYFVCYDGDSDFIMVNDGTGNFDDETAQRLGEYANVAFGTAVELRDFDLDGDLDVMKVSTLFGEPPFNSQGVFILWNNGQGDFDTLPFHEVPGTSSPYSASAGKLDAGPTWDLYVVQDGQDRVKKATVNGPHNVSWTNIDMTSPRTTGFGGNNHFADVDGDGDLDHGVGPIDIDIPNCDEQIRFALLRNDGTGNLTDPYTSEQNFHVKAHDFAFVDINRDGCLDIFMGLCTGWRVFIRQGCPPPPCYADCNASGTLTIADFGCFQSKFAQGCP